MGFLVKIKQAINIGTHKHKEHIKAGDNHLCSRRVSDALHKHKLRHRDAVIMIDNYLKDIKKALQATIKRKARTRNEEKVMAAHIDKLIHRQRERDSEELGAFIIDKDQKGEFNQARYNLEILNLKNRAIDTLEREAEDDLAAIELHGEGGPSKTAIVRHISDAKENYLTFVEDKKDELNDSIFTGNKSYRECATEINDMEGKVSRLKLDIVALCNKLKDIALDYQGTISKAAIKHQDIQAKLDFYGTGFGKASEAFGKIKYFGDIPAAINAGIQGVFEVMKSYHSMQEPVAAQQAGAKLMLQIVLDETKQFIENVEANFAAFQNTIRGWDHNIERGIKHDMKKQELQQGQEMLELKKKKYAEREAPPQSPKREKQKKE